MTVVWLFCRDDSPRYGVGASKLTSEEARRIGKAIARIPEEGPWHVRPRADSRCNIAGAG